MAVRIRLSDGASFVVQSSIQDLRDAVMKALEDDVLLEVRNGSGKMRVINPNQISYIEETDDESLTEAEEEILQAVEDRRAQEQPL